MRFAHLVSPSQAQIMHESRFPGRIWYFRAMVGRMSHVYLFVVRGSALSETKNNIPEQVCLVPYNRLTWTFYIWRPTLYRDHFLVLLGLNGLKFHSKCCVTNLQLKITLNFQKLAIFNFKLLKIVNDQKFNNSYFQGGFPLSKGEGNINL